MSAEDADMGGAAAAAASEGADADGQQSLDGMNATRVTFVGTKVDLLDENYKLGQHVEFLVVGDVVHVGDDKMADGHDRHVVKVRVDSINPKT